MQIGSADEQAGSAAQRILDGQFEGEYFVVRGILDADALPAEQRTVVNDAPLGTGTDCGSAGGSAHADEDAAGDGKAVLIAVETLFRSSGTRGDGESASDGDGSVGVDAVVARSVAINVSSVDDELAFGIDAVVVSLCLYNSSVDGEGTEGT